MRQLALLKKPKGFIVLFLLLALPVTLYMTKQVQDLRQRAQVTPSKMPARFGQALSFSGKNSYMKFVNTTNLTSSFQAEAWIKPAFDQSRINESYSLMSFYPNVDDKNCIDTLDINTNNHENNYTVGIGTSQKGNPGGGMVNVGIELKYNQWTHVAITVSDTDLTYYLNGRQAGIQSLSSPFCASPTTIFVGTYVPYINSAPMNFYKGEIDEIHVQNTITYSRDFNVPRAPLSSNPNTVALFHFDGNTQDDRRLLEFGKSDGVSFTNSTVTLPVSPTINPSTTPQQARIVCDVNGDSLVNITDFDKFYLCANGTAISCTDKDMYNADINKNGKIDTADISTYYRSCVPQGKPRPSGSLTPMPTIVIDPLSPTPNRISVTPPKAPLTPPAASPTLTAGSIYGSVYLDSNRNRTKDSSEKPLANGWISVYLQNRLVRVATVSSDGSFSIQGLSPNTYSVRLFPTIGYTVSTTNPVTLKLDTSKVHTVQFGVYTR